MPHNLENHLFLFPGQGSQYPGIGSDLFAAESAVRTVYENASDVLGYDMAKLSFEDPDNCINLTRFTQPVLLTHSIACLRALEARVGDTLQSAAVAGHSLGEYSALVAAGSIRFEDALRLVATRGELMSKHGQGEMEALPVDLATAQSWADKYFCAIAACNMPDQTVVGGSSADLDNLAAGFAEENPRRKTARLKTEGAFHTYYMVAAASEFRQHLDQAQITTPQTKVMSNYTGGFHDESADSVRTRLFFQLFHPVLWNQNLINAIGSGLGNVIEFGGGIGKGELPGEKRANLEGIVKKTFRRSDSPPVYAAVINSETLDKVAEQFAN